MNHGLGGKAKAAATRKIKKMGSESKTGIFWQSSAMFLR